mmetsp:Transcript_100820/g.285502  ORF Transcript_100820/g.285502 Transcript_100820/m.285502 type:complete len:250 (+) Transcript_100820:587-1336(+)
MRRVHEIDKAVPSVHFRVLVHREIHEIIGAGKAVRVDLLQEGMLRQLLRDVPHHQRDLALPGRGSLRLLRCGHQGIEAIAEAVHVKRDQTGDHPTLPGARVRTCVARRVLGRRRARVGWELARCAVAVRPAQAELRLGLEELVLGVVARPLAALDVVYRGRVRAVDLRAAPQARRVWQGLRLPEACGCGILDGLLVHDDESVLHLQRHGKPRAHFCSRTAGQCVRVLALPAQRSVCENRTLEFDLPEPK